MYTKKNNMRDKKHEQAGNRRRLCCHRNSWRRGPSHRLRNRRDITIPRMAFLARNSTDTVVGFAVTVTRLESDLFGLPIRFYFLGFGCAPRGKLPLNASETFQLQRLPFPLATGSTGTIQCAQLGIDSTGVRFRPESVAGMCLLRVIGASIFPGQESARERGQTK